MLQLTASSIQRAIENNGKPGHVLNAEARMIREDYADHGLLEQGRLDPYRMEPPQNDMTLWTPMSGGVVRCSSQFIENVFRVAPFVVDWANEHEEHQYIWVPSENRMAAYIDCLEHAWTHTAAITDAGDIESTVAIGVGWYVRGELNEVATIQTDEWAAERVNGEMRETGIAVWQVRSTK